MGTTRYTSITFLILVALLVLPCVSQAQDKPTKPTVHVELVVEGISEVSILPDYTFNVRLNLFVEEGMIQYDRSTLELDVWHEEWGSPRRFENEVRGGANNTTDGGLAVHARSRWLLRDITGGSDDTDMAMTVAHCHLPVGSEEPTCTLEIEDWVREDIPVTRIK